MTDNPTNIELVERMIQACKNIIFATSGLNSPNDVAKDVFAIENMETCLTIILESYTSLTQEGKEQLKNISWNAIEDFKKALCKQEKSDNEYRQLYRSCKDDIPTLQKKLESELSTM